MGRTLSSAFRAENLRDLLQGVDEDSQDEILTKHFEFAIRTLKQFCEFSILFSAFPWRFCLLQEEQYCSQVLQEMQREWELLLRLESHPNASTTWPLNQVHQVRWHVYREVMTFAEERSWVMCPQILALARAWDSDPCSTLSVENSFRSLRRGEKNQDGPASAPQLQAISIRSVNERFQKFEVIEPSPSDIHTVPVSQTMKAGVWDSRRCTGQETGLGNFSGMVKATVPSPHFLTRRSLNLWAEMKRTDGDLQRAWTAELVRPGQVLQDRESSALVVDAPFVVVKTLPLKRDQMLIDGREASVAEIELEGRFQLQ
ncbi:unnamed protein product, partial [Symbiodinium sp. CCMP2456]